MESVNAFYSWAMERPKFVGIIGSLATVVLEELPKVVCDLPDYATWANRKAIVHPLGDPRKKTVCVFMEDLRPHPWGAFIISEFTGYL